MEPQTREDEELGAARMSTTDTRAATVAAGVVRSPLWTAAPSGYFHRSAKDRAARCGLGVTAESPPRRGEGRQALGGFRSREWTHAGCLGRHPSREWICLRVYRNATVWSEVISKRRRQRWFLQLMVSSTLTR